VLVTIQSSFALVIGRDTQLSWEEELPGLCPCSWVIWRTCFQGWTSAYLPVNWDHSAHLSVTRPEVRFKEENN
jgi:hypothetical protein